MTGIKPVMKFCNLMTGLTLVILVVYHDDRYQPVFKNKTWSLVWYWSSRNMLYLNDWFITGHWGTLMIDFLYQLSRFTPWWPLLNWSLRYALDDWYQSSHQGLYVPQWLVHYWSSRCKPWWPVLNRPLGVSWMTSSILVIKSCTLMTNNEPVIKVQTLMPWLIPFIKSIPQ